MKRWRFVFTRRWFGYLGFAVAFAIACVLLANWQLARSHEAAAANELLKRNFDSTPVAIAEALPSPDAFRGGQEWQRVRVTGRYDESDQLIVRNRATDDGPGFEVLTPLRLADGSTFIVDRGWVAVGNRGGKPQTIAPAPRGTVTVIARLKPGEPHLAGQSASGDQIPTIELGDIHKQLGGDVYTGAYGLLQSTSPAPATNLTPVVTSPPVQDEGLHWSYMIQWICFALIGFFGLGYAIRQEYKHRNENDEILLERDRRRAAKRAPRAPTDAEIEDDLIDAHVG